MKGHMGGRDYYATNMALSEVPRFFKFNDWEQQEPSLRAQRVLNVGRIPEITNYMLENEEGYLFSSITASYNCPVTFVPNRDDERIGVIEMDLENMEFVINDGQHRAAAISAAIKENPDLGKDRISVLLFPMESLERLQQMFSDLNRFVHKTSRSMDILYDHRDHLSALVKDVEEEVRVFRGMVDKERTSLPVRSTKLFTLSSLYDANRELFGSEGVPDPNAEPEKFEGQVQVAIEYWNAVSKGIEDWGRVIDGSLNAPQLRQEKISTHSVVLRAVGGVGRVLLEQYPLDWRDRLLGLRAIDWRKSKGNKVNPLWDNVCIVAGSVVSNRQARTATQAVLKHELGLPLGSQEQQLVDRLRSMGWRSQRGDLAVAREGE
jgi:DNA sulfur modification protein DndB